MELSGELVLGMLQGVASIPSPKQNKTKCRNGRQSVESYSGSPERVLRVPQRTLSSRTLNPDKADAYSLGGHKYLFNLRGQE